MHGLPSDFDFTIFAGRSVHSICFYEYSVTLSFDVALSIEIESAFSHRLKDSVDENVVDVPPLESTLMQLIGKTVEKAGKEGKGTLVLQFAGGQILRCLDNTPMYECYHIIHAGKETIV